MSYTSPIMRRQQKPIHAHDFDLVSKNQQESRHLRGPKPAILPMQQLPQASGSPNLTLKAVTNANLAPCGRASSSHPGHHTTTNELHPPRRLCDHATPPARARGRSRPRYRTKIHRSPKPHSPSSPPIPRPPRTTPAPLHAPAAPRHPSHAHGARPVWCTHPHNDDARATRERRETKRGREGATESSAREEAEGRGKGGRRRRGVGGPRATAEVWPACATGAWSRAPARLRLPSRLAATAPAPGRPSPARPLAALVCGIRAFSILRAGQVPGEIHGPCPPHPPSLPALLASAPHVDASERSSLNPLFSSYSSTLQFEMAALKRNSALKRERGKKEHYKQWHVSI